MKISELQTFAAELHRDRLPNNATLSSVTYFHKGKWYELNGDPSDAAITASLDSSKLSSSRIRVDSSTKKAYFYVPELDAAVQVSGKTRYKGKTLTNILGSIDRAYRIAHNEYGATHSLLTGLVNKVTFTKHIAEGFSSVKGRPPSATTSPSGVADSERLCILVLDIDLFKQLNDNFGHDYGDVVLRSIAMRLSTFVSADPLHLRKVKLLPSHLSGEEFAVMAFGAITREDCSALASRLLSAIGESVLPSQAELDSLSTADADLTIPNETERHVTVSIGVASVTVQLSEDHDVAARRLLKQADTAMYRAKADGRNRVRCFDDILSRHGKVMEHDETMGFVAIDIGSNVGVKTGQEFDVFLPAFVGGAAFVINDGRTSRTVGNYPRRPLCQIFVTDVQSEMAFCRVRGAEGLKQPIAAGAILEAIPLGTISRPVSDFGDQTSGILSPDELNSSLVSLRKEKPSASVTVFSIRNIDEMIATRGNVEANRALTTLYGALIEAVPSSAKIGKGETTELIVIGDIDRQKTVDSVLKHLKENKAPRFHLSIGGFDKAFYETQQSSTPWDKSEFLESADTELARYAAANAEKADTLTMFTPALALSAIAESRRSGRTLDALTDFRRLESLGLINAFVYNQAALSALEVPSPQVQFALDSIHKARKLQPDQSLFVANEAFILANYLGQYADALSMYGQVLEGGETLIWVYFPSLLLSAIRNMDSYNSLSDDVRAIIVSTVKKARDDNNEMPEYVKTLVADFLSLAAPSEQEGVERNDEGSQATTSGSA